MPSSRYFGDDGVLTVNNPSGSEITVGKYRNATIRAEADHVELYTADSILREDVKRREAAIIVELEYVEFDEEFAQHWLGGGAAQSTLNDTSDVALFGVEFELDMTDHDGTTGDESLKAVVTNVHFPEMPLISATEGEYTAHSVTGRGDGVTYTLEQVA